jgi:hypothetical protein
MFQQEIEHEPSFGAWLLQTLAACFGPLIVVVVFSGMLGHGSSLFPYYAVTCLASLGIAQTTSRVLPAWVAVGRWIWLLPVLLELVSLTRNVFLWGVPTTLHEFIGFGAPMAPEEEWGIVLLTLPVWSCCWYSALMWWHIRKGAGSVPASHR